MFIMQDKKALVISMTVILVILIIFLVFVFLGYGIISGKLAGLVNYIKNIFSFGG